MSIAVRANPPRKFVEHKPVTKKALVNPNGFKMVPRKQSYNDALVGNNTLFYQNSMGNYLNDNKMNYATNAPMVARNSRNVWDAIQYGNLDYAYELRGLKNEYPKYIPTTKYNRLNINFNNDNPPHKVDLGMKPTRDLRDMNDKEIVLEDELRYDPPPAGEVLPTVESQITDKLRGANMISYNEKEDPLIQRAVKADVFQHADHTAVYVNSLQHRPDMRAPMKMSNDE